MTKRSVSLLAPRSPWRCWPWPRRDRPGRAARTQEPAGRRARRASPLRAARPALRDRPGRDHHVGQDFYHAVMVGGKASFFLSDWLAISGMFGHNLTKDLKTSFHERLEGVLPAAAAPDGPGAHPGRGPAGHEQDRPGVRRPGRADPVLGQVLAVRQDLRQLRLLRVRRAGLHQLHLRPWRLHHARAVLPGDRHEDRRQLRRRACAPTSTTSSR